MTRPATTTATQERAAAAQARGAALGGTGTSERAALPRDVGAARLVPCAAQHLRAKLVDLDGRSVNHLTGVASMTDTPYEMYDFFGPYEEVVAREAFTDTLAREGLDVAFLLNHRGMTMARTTNETLTLAMVDEGLGVDAYVNPKRQDVKDLVIAIDDGTIDQMSFAFLLEEGWWSDDFQTFKITKLDLHRGDVSAVNYGANPYTSIAARSAEIVDAMTRMPAGAARAAMARLRERPDLAEAAPSARGLAASAVLPPVRGLAEEHRSDRGRSVALLRTQLLVDDEYDS